jgi:hypothetical protein
MPKSDSRQRRLPSPGAETPTSPGGEVTAGSTRTAYNLCAVQPLLCHAHGPVGLKKCSKNA